jgi:predicted nucleic acid-binding protein
MLTASQTMSYLDFPAPGKARNKDKPHVDFALMSRTATVHKTHQWDSDKYLKDQKKDKKKSGEPSDESLKKLFAGLQESNRILEVICHSTG